MCMINGAAKKNKFRWGAKKIIICKLITYQTILDFCKF
jgi:hypothetical protein